MINNNLIFDLGFHNGDDTLFYLKTGFNVVAVEANTFLVENAIKKFKDYINNKKLVLINKAISNHTGKINFYIHPTKSDWSSTQQKMAESDGSKAQVICVDTIILTDLCKEYGVPYYLKTDIEGEDICVAKELFSLRDKPEYVSFEISKTSFAGIFSWLFCSGYKKYQLVNQMNNPYRNIRQTELVSDEEKVPFKFTEYSSGFFGKQLPAEKWLDYEEALSRYVKYRELKLVDNQELALGWLDLHAKLKS